MGIVQSKHRVQHYLLQRLLYGGSGWLLSRCSVSLHDALALCHNRVLSMTEACIQEWTNVLPNYQACPSSLASAIHTPGWWCQIQDFVKEVQLFHSPHRVVPPRSSSGISHIMVLTSAGVGTLCPSDNVTDPRAGSKWYWQCRLKPPGWTQSTLCLPQNPFFAGFDTVLHQNRKFLMQPGRLTQQTNNNSYWWLLK